MENYRWNNPRLGHLVTLPISLPKIGDRLLFAPVVLACIATTEVVARHLRAAATRATAGMLAAALALYVGGRCLAAYRTLGPESAARVAVLEEAAHGSIVTLPAFTVERSRYAPGEDLADEPRRRMLAARFGLGDIRLLGAPTSSDDQP